MKIHEYQAKEIFKKFNIPVQDGHIVSEKTEIDKIIDQVGKDFDVNQFVVKAQIHAGGRGKGGGVKFCPSKEKAVSAAEDILGMNLITHQTGEKGQLVRKIMIAEAIDIEKEFYVAITLDREKNQNTFIISTEGGMDIEQVAEESPEKIIKIAIHPSVGMQGFQARQIAFHLGLSGDLFKKAVKLFLNLYRCFENIDASIVEINPLVITEQGDLLALDAKVNIDDNALFRQKEILEMRDVHEENPAEIEASKFNLNFIKLDGNVGCMVNGAGLAMATMDIIKLKGGEPANFLDVGGTASAETVKEAFRILLEDENVKVIFINIFGGIVRCDRVANGIIQAVKELSLEVPVVVRLQGTNSDVAKKVLSESGLKIEAATELTEAAEKAINLI